MATRSKTAIWLIRQPLHILDELSQLPLSSTTLRSMFFEMKTMHSTLPTACSTVAEEVLSFWARANIPTTEKPHVVSKLKNLHQQYVRVSKNKYRRSTAQHLLETQFTVLLGKVFDIAHADWEKKTSYWLIDSFLQINVATG